jgi:hypothetical protein
MRKINIPLMFALLTLSLWGCAVSEPKQELKIDRAETISVKATVEAVNMVTRIIILRASDGRIFEIYAGPEVANLQQVRVGDEVVALYAESLAVRMAKPGEVRDESSQGFGVATPGSKPGGRVEKETTLTAEIVGIDKTLETARLKLPDGRFRVVKVQDPRNLDKVKVGDTIVVTYTEAYAISVESARK